MCPDQKWVAGITYIRLAEGWLYLAAILDCFSRRVVGWSMSGQIDAALVCQALEMALLKRCPQSDLVHHSDRGVQYASPRLRDLLQREGLTMSMSRKGDPWDNAMMESFFGSRKTEWIDTDDATEEETRRAVFKYIEMFYNPTRRHSALGYLSPAEYERRYEAGQSTPMDEAAQRERFPRPPSIGQVTPMPVLMPMRRAADSYPFSVVFTLLLTFKIRLPS